MTIEDKIEAVKRAAEAGFFGADPDHDYHVLTKANSPEERVLFCRWAYLVDALVGRLDADDLIRALWRVAYVRRSFQNEPTFYFSEKVQRALAGGSVDPIPAEPRTPVGWTAAQARR